MDKQYFLKLLWSDLSKEYRKLETIVDPAITWRRDSWINLSIWIDRFIASGNPQIEAISQSLKLKAKKKKQSRIKEELSVSDSTLERIYKTANDIAFLPEDFYDVQNPSSPKLLTLDILSAFVGAQNWNHYVYLKHNDEDIKRKEALNCVRKALEALNQSMLKFPKIDYSYLDDFFIPNGNYATRNRRTEKRLEHFAKENTITKTEDVTLMWSDFTIEWYSDKKVIVSAMQVSGQTDENRQYHLFILFHTGLKWGIDEICKTNQTFTEIYEARVSFPKGIYKILSKEEREMFPDYETYESIFLEQVPYKEAWHRFLFENYYIID